MTNLKTRLMALEKLANANITPDAAAIVFWPPVDEPGAEEARERIQAEILAHHEAGRKVIEFHVIDAS